MKGIVNRSREVMGMRSGSVKKNNRWRSKKRKSTKLRQEERNCGGEKIKDNDNKSSTRGNRRAGGK